MDLVLLELCIWSKLPQHSLTGMQYFNFTINNFTLLAIFFISRLFLTGLFQNYNTKFKLQTALKKEWNPSELNGKKH